jgi:serine/threonine-protein kinase
LKLGTVIANKFRIDRVIGRGAMGVVVEAMDLTLGRKVAVKLILPQHADDPQLRGRFIREAQAMTRLQSEHIARVHEVGELDDGTLFLAMELLEGQSLEQLIQGGALPVADAVDLILEALDALTEAHELGLVHRDIKPSNLFLSARKGKDPILKVLDFGIVKDQSNDSRLTATGTLPGTPAYMAPEQVALESHLINERADVWAIGVTLYELLTGDVPFTGSMSEMLTRIRTEAPPRLRARRPDVAPELEAVILRCLSKHPSDRFPNAGELARELRELRQFGLVRSERGHARREVQTEMSAVRKAEGSMRPRAIRDTAATEQDPVPSSRSTSPKQRASPPQKGGGKLLAITIVCVTVCALVALVLLMQGRFVR